MIDRFNNFDLESHNFTVTDNGIITSTGKFETLMFKEKEKSNLMISTQYGIKPEPGVFAVLSHKDYPLEIGIGAIENNKLVSKIKLKNINERQFMFIEDYFGEKIYQIIEKSMQKPKEWNIIGFKTQPGINPDTNEHVGINVNIIMNEVDIKVHTFDITMDSKKVFYVKTDKAIKTALITSNINKLDIMRKALLKPSKFIKEWDE